MREKCWEANFTNSIRNPIAVEIICLEQESHAQPFGNWHSSKNILKDVWNVKGEEKNSNFLPPHFRNSSPTSFQQFPKDSKMAIDLPETIPSIINSFKRSNSAKTLQKFSRNLKSCDKGSKFSFLFPKSCKNEQCQCSFPSCKDCQNKLKGGSECSENECKIKSAYIRCKHFDNNNKSELDAECEQSLLSEIDVKAELKFEKVYDWNSKEAEPESYRNDCWKNKKSIPPIEFCAGKKKNEKLLNSSNDVTKRRKKVFLLSSLGLALLSLAIFIRLFDPLEKILNWKLSLEPGSFIYNLWLAPPVTVYVKIYIFNFTNPKEFLAGQEKLKVKQLGPFVYTEHLENTNPVFHPNGTLSYIPRRSVKYVPELSVANPKSLQVIVPNIPFLGLASMIADSSMFTNLGFITLTKYLQSQPFLNLTVHDYFWGYNDPLVKMANKVVANKITFAKFGLMDRMYDEGDNLVTIRLSDNGLNVTDKGYLPQYSIDSWNGSPGLSAWGYRPEEFKTENGTIRPEPNQRCKFIRGASDGVVFPRNMSPKITHLVYRKTFCRIIPLVFDKETISKNGIPGYRYNLPENVFDTPDQNPAQACYCNVSSKCLPKGLSDITPCYYGIPAAVSFPHFLASDPKLLENIEGLSPSLEKHGTTIILQPTLGMPMEFKTRIQTNIIIKKIRYNSKIAPFSNLVLPIVWIELEMDGFPQYINFLIYLTVFIAPAFFTSITVICFVSGISLIIYSTFGCLTLLECIKSSNSYSPLKISPMINKINLIRSPRKTQMTSIIEIGKKNSIKSSKQKSISNV